MAVWLWSWVAMLAGIYPYKDHEGREFDPESYRARLAGTPIAGGWRFVFAGGLADWSFHSKFWYPFYHGAGHHYCCSRDLASRVIRALRFQDGSMSAGWKGTRISTSQFLAAVRSVSGYNPMFDVPGFSLALLRCDIMHALYLGLFLVSSANMLWELLQLGHFGPITLAMDLRLASAFASATAFCTENRLSLNLRAFKLATLGSPQEGRSPELHCKAHDSKIIASATWQLVEGFTCVQHSRLPTTSINLKVGGFAHCSHRLCTDPHSLSRFTLGVF